MTRATLLALASLALATTVMPDAAFADGRRDFGGRGDGRHGDARRLHTTLPQRLPPPRHFHGHRPNFGAIAPWGAIYASPSYATPVYVPEPVYVPTPTYVTPPPPPAYAPSAPAPTETVVEFPNGRYELRGDGVTTPYRWVWIPNPPSAPPVEEPAPQLVPEPPPARAPRAEFYRWTDDQGVLHLTDRWEKIPEAYRKRASKSHS